MSGKKGESVKIEGVGRIRFKTESGGSVELSEVYYTPGMVSNLLSVGTLERSGLKEVNLGNGKRAWKKDGKTVITSTLNDNNLYEVNWMVEYPEPAVAVIAKPTAGKKPWQRRLCHIPDTKLRKLDGMVFGYKYEECDHDKTRKDPVQKKANLRRRAFKPSPLPYSTHPNDLLHLDIVIFNVRGLNGEIGTLTITDDCSELRACLPLMKRSGTEILERLKEFFPVAERLADRKIKVIRVDNERGIAMGVVGAWLKELGGNFAGNITV